MNFQQQLDQLQKQYKIIDIVELDYWHTVNYEQAQSWLDAKCQQLYKEKYEDNERIIFVQRQGDVSVSYTHLTLPTILRV